MSPSGLGTSDGPVGAGTTDGADSSERCTSCILPRSVHGLGFNQDGVCDVCIAQKALSQSGADAQAPGDIEEILDKVRELGKNRKYDCLVGLSGGRDSSYLLYLLTRKHKLRCVAAYYPTPFTDDVIDENVQRTVSKLDVPLVRMNISHKFHQKYARRILFLYKRTRLPELVNLLCVPCKYVTIESFKIARRFGVKSIIYGGTKYEVFQFGPGHAPARPGKHKHSFGSALIRSLLILKRGITLLAKCPGLIPLMPAGFKASVLYINPHTPYLRLRYPDILRCDYFHHAKYDEDECIKVITSELDWQLPPGLPFVLAGRLFHG